MYTFLIQYNSDEVSKTYVVQSALNNPDNAFYSICDYLRILPNAVHKNTDDDGNIYYINTSTVVVKQLFRTKYFDIYTEVWE